MRKLILSSFFIRQCSPGNKRAGSTKRPVPECHWPARDGEHRDFPTKSRGEIFEGYRSGNRLSHNNEPTKMELSRSQIIVRAKASCPLNPDNNKQISKCHISERINMTDATRTRSLFKNHTYHSSEHFFCLSITKATFGDQNINVTFK